jgi:hypothetical protein
MREREQSFVGEGMCSELFLRHDAELSWGGVRATMPDMMQMEPFF